MPIPVSSELMPPSFPGKQAQRGRGTSPRSHSSLDWSCGRPPAPHPHPAWPRHPESLGRAVPMPTCPKAQAGIRPPPSPHHPVRGRRRPSGLREAPPSASARRALILSRPGPHPRNLPPIPPRAAPERRVPGGDPGKGAPGDLERSLQTLHPEPAGCALGRADGGRWADKRGDRQGLAYHGAVALGAHRAPRDRAAPGGRAGAAP